MKPQDIVILLKVLLLQGQSWSQRDLAKDLSISVSEINHSLKRLEAAKLYNPRTKKVLKRSALELILHGLKYVFPPEIGSIKRGVPTAHAAGVLADTFVFDPTDVYVWPDPEGKVRGQTLQPLYPSVPEASRKDSQLYELLALIDTLRVGRARESKLAKERLSERLLAA